MSLQIRKQKCGNAEVRKYSRLCLHLCISAFLLSACGFTPLYGKKDSGAAPSALAGVKIDPIDGGRMGQQFKIALEDSLNPGGAVPASAPYHLTATLVSAEAPIGVSTDGTVSRYNVYLDSTYILFRTSDGEKVSTGKVRQISSYNNATNAYFSTFVSQQDAIKQGVEELSEIYRERLIAYLTGPDSGKPDKTVTGPDPQPVLLKPNQYQPNNPFFNGPLPYNPGYRAN